MAGRRARSLPVVVALGFAVTMTACGGSSGKSAVSTTSSANQSSTLPNACPADGCKVRIVSVTGAGAELKIAFEANYAPDVSRNHFHVFWDTYTPKQVSDDAEPRFGVTQGAWVPTSDNPFTTTDAVAVAVRKQSTKVCVTAGDRNHNVIDPVLFDCRVVADLLH
jgi:hypothetical protein